MLHEGAGEGPRRIIFDVRNISEHEKAAGAKSEGLTIGPCCDYNGSKPVLLCDLEIVFLVLMRLRTSEVRELQAIMSHQGLVIMGGNAAVATAMADHWKAEREAKPSNVLLQFLGAAVEHEAAQASVVDTVGNARATDDNAPEPQELPEAQQVALVCEAALPRLVAIIVPKFQEVLDNALGRVQGLLDERLPTQSARAIVNINCSGRDAADLDRARQPQPEQLSEIYV